MTVANPRRKLTVVDSGGTAPPPGGTDSNAWKDALTRRKDGGVEGTLHNCLLILENDEHFRGMLWLNESSNQVVLGKDPPWTGGNRDEFTDTDGCELAAWLQSPDRYYMSVSDELALKSVITVARRHRRHPIREYLRSLKWDGTPRVERMFVDLFGAEDKAYNLQAAVCFMVSAVSRLLWLDPKQPFTGSKVDFMVVLEGGQGKKKTSSFEALFGAQWYVETLESPAGKDFYQVILGCWGVEIAEMDSFSKADVTSVKGAITRRVDKYRAPYERVPRSYRRECVFVGTTNETEYLRDHTGGRRFLPVRVTDEGVIELEKIIEQRDQLWAEAVHLFEQGVQWWKLPDDAAAEQEARYFEDSWEGRISRWLTGMVDNKDPTKDRPYPAHCRYGKQVEWTTTDEILAYAIGADAAKHGRPEQMRVSSIMKRLGWVHRRELLEGVRERRWYRASGDAIADQASASSASAVDMRGGVDDDCPF